MATTIGKVDVWAGEVDDRPGGLANKLEPLAEAGANFEFVIARRSDGKPGTTVVFLSPVKGSKQTRRAGELGFSRATNLWSVRLECTDKAGLGARIARAIGEAGINMRGLSSAAISKKAVVYFAFNSEADAKRAIPIIRRAVGAK